MKTRASLAARTATIGLPLALAFGVMACGGRGQEDFAKIQPEFTVAPEQRGDCYTTPLSAGLPDADSAPAGVPFPTPAGRRAVPTITGIPLPPGAAEVDGFEADKGWGQPSGRGAVQVFDVALPPDAVLAFFEATFKTHGWVVRGSDNNPAGVQCEFVLPGDRGSVDPKHWIAISTAYVPRPGEDTQPPPGFRGKGVPFAEPTPGSTRFWLITPK